MLNAAAASEEGDGKAKQRADGDAKQRVDDLLSRYSKREARGDQKVLLSLTFVLEAFLPIFFFFFSLFTFHFLFLLFSLHSTRCEVKR
jgi:hypothetical protein